VNVTKVKKTATVNFGRVEGKLNNKPRKRLGFFITKKCIFVKNKRWRICYL